MFKTERVGCYLNGFAGHGDDQESKELKLVFHVTPISQELAAEVSPHLADRLFRWDGLDGTWQPAREITKAMFTRVQVQMQNITFNDELQKAGSAGMLVTGAAIYNLRAQRAFQDSFEFRLEFDVVVPMDGITMGLVERYYKSTCFLTMEPTQREITYETSESQAEQENAFQEAADAEEPPPPVEKKKRGRPKKNKAQVESDAGTEVYQAECTKLLLEKRELEQRLGYAEDDLKRWQGACRLCANPDIEDPWRHEHDDKGPHWHHCIDPGDGLPSDCANSDWLERVFQGILERAAK